MDVLSDVLRVTHITGGVFLSAKLTAPWCIVDHLSFEMCGPDVTPSQNLVHYHFVIEGQMQAEVPGMAPIEVHAGEALLLPRNDVHKLASNLTIPPLPATVEPPRNGGLYSLNLGGGGEATRLICGYLACDGAETNPLIVSLPPAFKLDVASSGAADWIRSTFHFAAQEVSLGKPGATTMLAKLSEVLFLEAVRHYVDSLPDSSTGWLAGLRDPYVAKALSLLHSDPARHWTVSDLGAEIGLSRSALADRFGQLIGLPPMQYLHTWRMQIAARMLSGSSQSLAQIGEALGYESEAAFSRAFKKYHGVPPAGWRRGKRGEPQAADIHV